MTNTMTNTMVNTKFAESVTILFIVIVTTLALVTFVEIGVEKSQDIRGYWPTTSYKTNSLGEIVIEKIVWKNK